VSLDAESHHQPEDRAQREQKTAGLPPAHGVPEPNASYDERSLLLAQERPEARRQEQPGATVEGELQRKED
jgi:hypothetical protein